jgi:hypothetical protein
MKVLRLVAPLVGLLSGSASAQPLSYRPQADSSSVPTALAIDFADGFNRLCTKATQLRGGPIFCGITRPVMNPTIIWAWTLPDGPRRTRIVFSDPFLGEAAQHGPSAAFSVVAHELGHHMHLFLGPFVGRTMDPELLADEWAGCLLGLRNDDWSQVESWVRAFARTNPLDPNARMAAMRAGALRCQPTF